MPEHPILPSVCDRTLPPYRVFMPEHPILACLWQNTPSLPKYSYQNTQYWHVCDRTLPPYQSIHTRTPNTGMFVTEHSLPTKVFMPEHPILASVCDRTLPPCQSIHARTPATNFYSFHYTPTISVCSCWNTYHECLFMQEHLYQCVFMLEHSPINVHVCLC